MLSALAAGAQGKFQAGQAATPSYPVVTPHPAPDGSGVETNLSDTDYAKFHAGQPSPPTGSQPAAVAPQPQPPQGASTPTFDMLGALTQGAKGQFQYTPPAPPPDAGTPGGIVNNLTAGANDTIAQGIGALPNLVNSGLNLIPRGINAVAGTNIPLLPTDAGGMIERGMEGVGIHTPQTVPANSEAERMARAVGGGIASLPLMALGGGALEAAAPAASLAARVGSGLRAMPVTPALAPVAAGSAIGQGASDAVPEPFKPYAELAGNLAGGGAAALGHEAIRLPMQAGRDALGVMGVGGKTAIGDQRVTTAQAQRASNMLAQSATGGEQGLREGLAANPEAPEGYKDTLAQASQNQGLRNLEESARVAKPEPFLERGAQQNEAQVKAIRGAAPPGDPAMLGQWFTQQVDAIDAAGQAGLAGQRAGVGAQTGTLGGHTPVEDQGEGVRTKLTATKGKVASAKNELFDIAAADSSMGLPTAAIKAASERLNKEQDPDFGKVTDPSVQPLAGLATQMPDVVAFGSIKNYREALNDALATASSGANPNVRAVRQLTILKNGIAQAISDAIAGRVNQEQSLVAAGRLAPESTLEHQVRDWYAGRAATGDGGSGAEGAFREGASGRLSPSGGTLRAERETGGRSGDASGNPGVSDKIPLQPFDAAAAGRLDTANKAHADYKETYSQGAVGRVLRKGPGGYGHSVQDADLMRRFFTGSESEGENVDQLAKALGGTENMAAAGREYLASDLRAKGIIEPDGTLDGAKFDVWQRKHAAGINRIPGLKGQFSTLAKAQQAVDDAEAAHVAEMKSIRNGALKHILKGEEPSKVVASAMASPQDFRKITAAVRRNPDANAAWQRAIAEYLVSKTVKLPNSEEGGFLASNAFQKFFDANKAMLKGALGGQGINNLEMVAAAERRRVMPVSATRGSDTTQKLLNAKRHGFAAAAHGSPGLVILTMVGEQLGEHLHGGAGAMVGAVALPVAKMLIDRMHAAGIETINDLVTEALLNPDLARELVQKVPPSGKLTVMAQKRIAAKLHAAVMSDTSRQAADQTH